MLLHEWQTLHFAVKAADPDIESQIDSQRSALFLLNGSRARTAVDKGVDASQDWLGALNDSLDTYHTMVDNNPVNIYAERVAMKLPKDNEAIRAGIIDVKSTMTWDTIQQLHPFLKECTDSVPKVKLTRNPSSSVLAAGPSANKSSTSNIEKAQTLETSVQKQEQKQQQQQQQKQQQDSREQHQQHQQQRHMQQQQQEHRQKQQQKKHKQQHRSKGDIMCIDVDDESFTIHVDETEDLRMNISTDHANVLDSVVPVPERDITSALTPIDSTAPTKSPAARERGIAESNRTPKQQLRTEQSRRQSISPHIRKSRHVHEENPSKGSPDDRATGARDGAGVHTTSGRDSHGTTRAMLKNGKRTQDSDSPKDSLGSTTGVSRRNGGLSIDDMYADTGNHRDTALVGGNEQGQGLIQSKGKDQATRISTTRHFNKLCKQTSDNSSNRKPFDNTKDGRNQQQHLRRTNCDDVIEHSQDAREMVYSQETHQMEPRRCKSFKTMGEAYVDDASRNLQNAHVGNGADRDFGHMNLESGETHTNLGRRAALNSVREMERANDARVYTQGTHRHRASVHMNDRAAASANGHDGNTHGRDAHTRGKDGSTQRRNKATVKSSVNASTPTDVRSQTGNGASFTTNSRYQSIAHTVGGNNKGTADSTIVKGTTGNANGNNNTNMSTNTFKTAAMLHQANIKNGTTRVPQVSSNNNITNNGASGKRSLGGRRNGNNKFVPPLLRNGGDSEDTINTGSAEVEMDERLKGLDPKIVEMIMNEIMDTGPGIDWNDIAGLKHAKKTILEIVVWPLLRPDIFTGLRGPPKGILLFGPPGTGKTLIGKCIASQSKATFFSISASSLTSKWVGEGEKMVRALFAVARIHQPAVIFVDEIDSLLSTRSSTEHESSRRIKTEFLVQLDGAATSADDRILLVGATNLPQEIDDAARRRLVKRLYIPLPDKEGRQQLFDIVLASQAHSLTPEELEALVQKTKGYSGSDISNLCKEAALGPIRNIEDICNVSADQVRPMSFCDFEEALLQVRASVSQSELEMYVQWNNNFGSLAVQPT
ncbi:hypothetical protein SARC_01080 [Sphaeroforma arctica JP610]|uniref:Fidgetin-like protein 1 n=1 Tax=Sphaeroforma arctica JP610 TaxID=667725 RepID=A0A0L0GCP5_9EUKA|nr:hypothetical protein SARC_01080 [Sphaeroforma arctica JP610]KNC86787.1 hypothetical protein SARC_01080 [Sphaeroforma arctica JP610]|eukprot:XP_014160689.1 hypothetical protein SARC_01080 [Sphaeroforma arctica JP610]